jgi:DNA polymerase III subunit epsilon
MNFAITDTETTGLEPGSRLVEIHSILCSDKGDVIKEFTSLVDPCMPIPPDAGAVHGITNEDIRNAGEPDACSVLLEFMGLLAEYDCDTIIAHNAPYDIGIIGLAFGAADMAQPIHLGVIDTCAIARSLKVTKKNSLDALVEHYGITRRGKEHRAESDCHACKDYFDLVRKMGVSPSPAPWSPEHEFCEAPTDGPIKDIYSTIREGGEMSFDYTDAKGEKSSRTIIPYGIARKNGVVYFHGLCKLRGERRTFQADRVTG